MASRFVSGGTNEEPTERDEAWLEAQQAIEAKRQEKVELGKQADGKSLYETLQANKAAKQEAFEEAARLKNQFRSLDDDEVDFLDSVLESTRAKEAEVKKQTSEQLDAFKQAQQEAEKAASQQDSSNVPDTAEAWTTGPRKRKKGRDSTIGGVKLRRTSTTEKQPVMPSSATEDADGPKKGKDDPVAPVPQPHEEAKAVSEKMIPPSSPGEVGPKTSASKSPSAATLGLGLVAYSSDEDD